MAQTLTPNYSLNKYDTGDNPGADALNANWTTIDEQVFNRDLEILALDADVQTDLDAVMINVRWRTVVFQTINKTITTADLRTYFSNANATGQLVFTLPAALATVRGQEYSFLVTAAQNVRIAGAGSDQIRIAASISTATTGYVENATIGGVLTLLLAHNGLWIATATQGTWSVV